MLRIGAHVSIAGGFHKAVSRERDIGGNCGQIFVHSPRSWSFTSHKEEDFDRFKDARQGSDIKPMVVHASYLINIASPKDELFNKSVGAMSREIELAGRLGIEYYVFHPGSYTGGSKEEGMGRIARGLNQVQSVSEKWDVMVLLEDTSGKGKTLGRTFSELRQMMDGVDYEIGVCFDTCHGFTAGYPIHTEDGLDETIDEMRNAVGMDKVKIIHLNDSKAGFDSRVDRHEHIGMGEIGEQAMRRIVNHPDLRDKPFILETPADARGDFKSNIGVVRSLYKGE